MMCGMKLFAQNTSELFIRTNNSEMTIIDHENGGVLSFGEFEGKLKNVKYIPLVSKNIYDSFLKLFTVKTKSMFLI
jgi:hypothetical protein